MSFVSSKFPGRTAAAAYRTACALSVAGLLAVLGGCATVPKAQVPIAQLPPDQMARAAHNLQVFNAAWDLVNRRHYDPKFQGVDWEEAAARFGPQAAAAPDDRALYRTINAMVGLLRDSHTRALPPVQVEERRTQVRARTGFNMARMETRWVVMEVLPESPAQEAGVKPGWIVEKLNGEAWGPRSEFRPRAGETATWEFIDENDRTVTLDLVAKRLSIASRQTARELPGGFVYLRFDEFDALDRRWLSRQLKQHTAAPGVVVDLRRNPGGDTFSLGTSIGEFFDRAVDCGTFITRSGARTVKNSWQIGSANYRGPVVVLVDAGTGSAAEIFSAVLQDHGRATVVGRKTAGAVLASWFHRLPDGGELQLSREDYVAPKGRRIEANGVMPDVMVPRTLKDLRQGRDPDLEAAVRVLSGEKPPVEQRAAPVALRSMGPQKNPLASASW
ncbi:MAG: hypothetical protein RIQ93_2448 [Verrucomicrobiota bacterium]|jgi:carboxyl-terminal processing protease